VIVGLKFSAEGLVQQRLFQLVKRGELALVEGLQKKEKMKRNNKR
jgi:hypothetical protein